MAKNGTVSRGKIVPVCRKRADRRSTPLFQPNLRSGSAGSRGISGWNLRDDAPQFGSDGCILSAMNDEPGTAEMDDPFSMETARVVQILARLVQSRHVSVRSLEKKMGVGDSVFSKVLKGKITLHVRHVLMICTALEIEWKDFFATAYAGGTSLVPAAAPPPQGTEWEEMIIALLTRLGVLPLAAAPAPPPSADDH